MHHFLRRILAISGQGTRKTQRKVTVYFWKFSIRDHLATFQPFSRPTSISVGPPKAGYEYEKRNVRHTNGLAPGGEKVQTLQTEATTISARSFRYRNNSGLLWKSYEQPQPAVAGHANTIFVYN